MAIVPSLALSIEFEEGQIWKYKTRFLESGSTIVILKLEEYKDLGKVIHVRVNDINMINPVKGTEINEIPHLPFKKFAIVNSITKLVSKNNKLPEFSEGYKYWKKAYDSGEAGAFETNVKETLRAMLGAEWVEKK